MWESMQAVDVKFSQDLTHKNSLKSVSFWESYLKNKKMDVVGTHCISLTYFTGRNQPPKKWALIGILKPTEPHSPWDARCIIFVNVQKQKLEIKRTISYSYNYTGWAKNKSLLIYQ